jgi:hypothetical protein
MFGTGKRETKPAPVPEPPKPSISLDDFDDEPIDPMDDLALEIGKATNKTLF